MSGIDPTGLNISILIPKLEEGSFWKDSALAVGKVVLGILTFSIVSAGVGKAMHLGGARLISKIGINSSLGLQQAGKALFLVGKYAFLSVAVPTYIAVYEFPKWIFNEGLPKMARLTHQYVIIPVCNGIIHAIKFFSERFIKMAQAIYNHVLVPLGDMVEKVAVWTWKAVIIPVVNKVLQVTVALKDKIAYVFQAIYNYVLVPFGGMVGKTAVWTWKAVIIPTLNSVAHGSRAIKNLAIPVAQRIYNYALKPLGHFIGQAFGSACEYTGHVFTAVADAGNAAVNSTYEAYLRLVGRG